MHKYSKVKLSDQFIVNLESILGKGSTGCVYEGTNIKNNSKVAVKVVELSKIDNEVTKYLLEMEKMALMQLSSIYVLKGLKVIQDQKYCFMVTEYCNGGTLKKYIQEKVRLTQQSAFQLIKCILLGYQNLVDRKILHRDLKPANIMIHNMNPKIIDFGYCEIAGYKKPKLQYNVGSPSYMAPQSFRFNIYSQKSEIWSIGVIYYECVTGKTLDQGASMEDVFKMIEKQGICYPEHVSSNCRHIINTFLKVNPQSRPRCSDLLENLFMGEVGTKNLPNFFNVNYTVNIGHKESHQRKTFNTSHRELKRQNFVKNSIARNLNNQITIYSGNKNEDLILNRQRPIFSAYERTNQHNRAIYQKENKKQAVNQRKTNLLQSNRIKHNNSFRYTSLFQNLSHVKKEAQGKDEFKVVQKFLPLQQKKGQKNCYENIERAIKMVKNEMRGADMEWERKKMISYRS